MNVKGTKQGKSLSDWAAEIDRQAQAKRDFVADGAQLKALPDEGGVKLEIKGIAEGGDAFAMRQTGHDQLAQRLAIPKPYYERLRANDPELLAANVNRWLPEAGGMMVRTLDHGARAFLSPRYRRLDAIDLAQAILPVVAESRGELVVQSAEITDTRLYLKVSNPALRADVKPGVGDIVEAGIVAGDSEIGMGSAYVDPWVLRLVCLNGMKVPVAGLRKHHVGRRIEVDSAAELYADETLQADDRAFWLKFRDVFRASLVDVARFERIVEGYRVAVGVKVEDPVKTVELTAKQYKLVETEQAGILRHLIEGGDLSQWGLANAITRAAQDVESYDRSTELEELGGQVICLPKSSFKTLALAA